jgi:competence protein ComEC
MKQYTYSSAIGLLILAALQFITLSPSDQKLRVYFLDVGQGDSALIRYPTGEYLLIDTGKDSKVFRELDKVLPWYDKTIDYVLLTHGDLDHVGAMLDVLDRYKVEKVFVSEFFGKIEVEQDILERL